MRQPRPTGRRPLRRSRSSRARPAAAGALRRQPAAAGRPAARRPSKGLQAYEETQFDRGLRLPPSTGLSFPTAGNLLTDTGTIAFLGHPPERYPASSTGRHYLLAASAHPDEGPVYTGTLALRREGGEEPRWNFWTTPESGEAGRNDLTAPDTLDPGPQHFAISWDRAAQRKSLYINGVLAASATGVELPADIGAALGLGRWSPGAGSSGVTFDELAIFNRALAPAEVAELAAARAPLRAGAQRVAAPELWLDTNALDNAGGIMGVQLGVNGVFGDPQPYEDSYPLTLPAATGVYTVAARFFDRAGNSTAVSTTIELVPPQLPSVALENPTPLGATLVFSQSQAADGFEVQVAASPDFADAPWQRLPARRPWIWRATSRVAWVRFRTGDGLISPALALGPEQITLCTQ